MTDHFLDNSLNISKKSLMCNHCMYDCITIDNMKEHYRSEFHKYNLNRVTNNLNPLFLEEYLKKKEFFQKTWEVTNKVKIAQAELNNSTMFMEHKCDACRKTFASLNKFKEHSTSRSHKKNEEIFTQNLANEAANPPKAVKQNQEEELTAIDDIKICLFCNRKNENLEDNIIHMINAHKFEVPFLHCIKSYKGLLELLAKKIFKYSACLTCDAQKFKNYKALQNHMADKQHTAVNHDDLEEFLYKYYDKKKFLAIKEKDLRRTKEYKILKIKLSVESKLKKTEKKENEDGWETISEDEAEEENVDEADKQKIKKKKLKQEAEDDDYEPIELPNGELLMEDGTVIGNKIYQIYYRQRLREKKFGNLVDNVRKERLKVVKNRGILKGRELPKLKFFSVTDSNKSSFIRVNSLFKACKQVNV